jgi:hypothetical protein
VPCLPAAHTALRTPDLIWRALWIDDSTKDDVAGGISQRCHDLTDGIDLSKCEAAIAGDVVNDA